MGFLRVQWPKPDHIISPSNSNRKYSLLQHALTVEVWLHPLFHYCPLIQVLEWWQWIEPLVFGSKLLLSDAQTSSVNRLNYLSLIRHLFPNRPPYLQGIHNQFPSGTMHDRLLRVLQSSHCYGFLTAGLHRKYERLVFYYDEFNCCSLMNIEV